MTTPDDTQLRKKAVRGLKLAGAATVGKTVLDVAAQLALARILVPEHFGVFATAQALAGFVSCLTDLAGLKFLIRRPAIDRRALSTVFWLELVLGVVVAGAWALAAVPILAALGKPEQIPFAQALAIWIVAERLMLPRALHDHAMRFGPVNLGMAAGVVVGSATLVGCALAGFGPWTFVVGLIARTVATAAWMWKAANFVPSFEFDRGLARELAGFGTPLMLTTAITFAYTNIDYIIVGAMMGDHLLGIYYAAYRYPHYMIQFNVILNSVVFPAFARARDNEHIARGLRYVTRYSGAIAFPPMIALWTEGEPLVRWLLGDPEKWSGALFPFQVFTTLAGLRLTFTHWGHVFVIRGKTRPLLWASIWNLPAIAVGTWIGARYWGIEGAAVAVAAISWATIAVCCFVLMKKLIDYSYIDALSPVLKAALGCAATILVLQQVTPAGDLWSFARLAAGMLVYAAAMWKLCGEEILRLYRNRG